jgi:small GTP-binding protein
VGNPNVGKSVLFKNLTDRYVTVSNFPGTTVEIVRAKASFNGHDVAVIDTPGINDLSQRSDDARVTRDLLDQHDDVTIVQVADAKNLRRALLLTLQLAELSHPIVLVLNMVDELDERGGKIDTERLSEILGVPVVTTVAPRNEGTKELIAALSEARPPMGSWLAAEPVDEYEGNRSRLAQVNDILAETYSISQPKSPSFKVRLGFWAMHPVKGIAFLAVALLTVFWFVGLFGAGTLVDLFEIGVFDQRVAPLAIGGVDVVLPFPHTHDTEALTVSVAVPLTPVHQIGLVEVERTVAVTGYSVDPGATLNWTQRVIRHRASNCDNVLPGLQYPRRFRVLLTHGDHGESCVQDNGPERQGSPAHDTGPRVRHHGHDDDQNTGNAQGAAHHDDAPGAGNSLFGSAGGVARAHGNSGPG